MAARGSTGGSKDIFDTLEYEKTLCRKPACLQKGKHRCRYCDQSFCEEHRAPLPDENRNDFEGKGHSCDKFPANRSIEYITKRYPYLTETNQSMGEILGDPPKPHPKDPKKESENKPKPGPRPETPKPSKKPEPTGVNSLSWLFWAVLVVIGGAILLWVLFHPGFSDRSLESPNPDQILSDNLFQKVNSVRADNDLQPFEKIAAASNMALAIAKVNANGTAYSTQLKDQLATQFGVNGDSALFNGRINESQGYGVSYFAAHWGDLDHLVNKLLNQSYGHGGVACYQSYCVLVISTESSAKEIPQDKAQNKDETSLGQNAWGWITARADKMWNWITSKANNIRTSVDEAAKKSFIENLESYKTNPKSVSLYRGEIQFTVYGGLNDYLAGLPRSITYSYTPPTTRDFILRDINENKQKELLMPLVYQIENMTSDKRGQAYIVINMVQSIPYDWEAFRSNNVLGRYPYQVLYDMKGVCMEKADLMVFLLRELGFGTAIFEFEKESHRAVGIKCPRGNYNTEYCFVEAAASYPVGQIPNSYVGGADIRNAIPEVVPISDGLSYS